MVSYSEAAVFVYLHMFSFSSFTLCFICAFQFLFCAQHREIEWILFWLHIFKQIQFFVTQIYFIFHLASTIIMIIIIIHILIWLLLFIFSNILLTTLLLQIKLSIRWQFYAFKTLHLVSLFTKKLFCYWHNICFT